MKRIGAVVQIVLCVGVVAGCTTMGRQPHMQDALISPARLKPGDTAIVTVKVVDKFNIVDRVVGVVVEDDRMKLKLRDDGEPPDAKTGDGVWTLQVDVPFVAPPGEFTLELTAYNTDGEIIMVKTGDASTAPLSVTCDLVIEYPPEEPSSASN